MLNRYIHHLELLINFACWTSIILKRSTPCILAVNFKISVLIFINKYTYLFVCIYILCAFSWNKKRKSTSTMHGAESFKTVVTSAITNALWFGQLCAEEALAFLVGLSSFVSTQTNVIIALLGLTFACVSVRKHIVFLSRETDCLFNDANSCSR